MGLRTRIKKVFDRIVFTSPRVNWLLRNINKKLSRFTRFRLRPYGVMRVRFRSGLSFRMATNETSSVTKLLFWNGPDHYEYSRIFERLARRCRCFLDIGANTGYYALLAGAGNPAMRVYAFEPATAPHHYLVRNIALNGLPNVEAFKIALSDREGEIDFHEIDNPTEYHTRYNLAGTGSLHRTDNSDLIIRTRTVRTTTLDQWVMEAGVQTIDLIKLDTEGTEDLILKGAEHVLRQHQPIIICEVLFQVIEDKLENIMRGFGYAFYNHRDGKLYKTPSLLRKTDDGFRDCFFVPVSKTDWVTPFLAEDAR